MLRVKQSCHQNVAHSNSLTLTDCITVEPTAIQLTGKVNTKIVYTVRAFQLGYINTPAYKLQQFRNQYEE